MVSPIANETRFSSGSMVISAVIVFLRIGSSEYSVNAMIAGTVPSPNKGIINASNASDGIVCINPATYKTALDAPGFGKTITPNGIPMAQPTKTAIPVRTR